MTEPQDLTGDEDLSELDAEDYLEPENQDDQDPVDPVEEADAHT